MKARLFQRQDWYLLVAENYPDLKASANFVKLQEELTIQKRKFYSRQLLQTVLSATATNFESFLQISQDYLLESRRLPSNA